MLTVLIVDNTNLLSVHLCPQFNFCSMIFVLTDSITYFR